MVKYSIRPQPLRLPCQIPHYTVDDHLSPLYLRLPVVYSTYMSSTGWGIRTLSDLELASCFELPDYVLWDDRFATDIVPIQMCRSIVDLIIHRLCPQSPDPQKKPRHDLAGEQREITPDGVWLPQISRWLPGSWAEAQISDKAVKFDDAGVDCRPWHQRISLIFPCSSAHLQTIERFLARRWRRNVILSLFKFLNYRHGRDWLCYALKSKRLSPLCDKFSSTKSPKLTHNARGESKDSVRGG